MTEKGGKKNPARGGAAGGRSLYFRRMRMRVESPDCRAFSNASTSSSVFCAQKLMRSEQSAAAGVSPKANSVLLGPCACEEQAEPLETAIPRDER